MLSATTKRRFNFTEHSGELAANFTFQPEEKSASGNRPKRSIQKKQNPPIEYQSYSVILNKVYSSNIREHGYGAFSLFDFDKGWKNRLKSRFDELRNLENGWDGYGGVALDHEIEVYAKDLLNDIYDARVSQPSLVPGSDGSLQIEWHVNNCDLGIDVLSRDEVIACLFNHENGAEEEIEVGANREQLSGWVRQLVT